MSKGLPIAALSFRGNRHFESRLLGELLGGANAVGRPYEPDELLEGLLRLGEYYQERGFIQALVGEPLVVPSADGGSVAIEVPVSEGERFRIGEVSLEGEVARHQPLLGLHPGEPFSPGAVARGVGRLNGALKARGLVAVPRLAIRRDRHVVDVAVELRRGVD